MENNNNITFLKVISKFIIGILTVVLLLFIISVRKDPVSAAYCESGCRCNAWTFPDPEGKYCSPGLCRTGPCTWDWDVVHGSLCTHINKEGADCAPGCGGGCGGGGDTIPPVCGVQIEPSVTGGNLVMNPSFEGGANGLKYWTSNSGLDRQLDGTFWGIHKPHTVPSMEVYDTISQDIPVEKGAIYFVRVWAKARYYEQEGDENWGVARFSIDGSRRIVVVEGKFTFPWTKFEGTFVAKDRTMTLELIADWAGDNSWYAEVAFDDIVVKKIEGADSTSDQDVKLKIGVWDDKNIGKYRIRNQGKAWERDNDGEEIWQETERLTSGGFGFFNQSFDWTLSNSYGVDVQVQDGWGNKSEICLDTIGAQGISGYVWKDENGNGRKGSDEDYYTKGDFTIVLKNSAGERVASTTPSTEDGSFSFPADTGQYRLEIKIPDDVVSPNDWNWTGTRWRLTIPDLRADKDVSLYGILNNLRLYTKADESDNWLGLDRDYPIRVLKNQTTNAWLGFWKSGEITGRIYETPDGSCSGSAYSDTDWSVTCQNQIIGGKQVAEQLSSSKYQCQRCWENNCLRILPQSLTYPYIMDFTPPTDWILACTLGNLSVYLDVRNKAGPGFYLWQGVGPWFQTQEGDVHGQNISVPVPKDEYFCLAGDGGTPGVVSYESGTPDFSPGSVSETGWLANTSFSRKKYDYFYQLLGSPTVDNFNDLNNITADGVYYSVDNVDINAGFPGGRKAMVLVNGNVDIKTNIDVPIGSFLAIIASGKIDIADSVSRVEGIFIADGAFDAGTAATALTAEGMFVANSFDLDGRDLGALNESTPAIKFIYRPDFWLNAPAELLVPSYTWQELAP